MSKNIKDWISYGSAVFMILSGALLSYISFFTIHIIESSVLIYLSEALTFSGGIFGVTLYFNNKIKVLDNKIDSTLKSSPKRDSGIKYNGV
nr:MAG TPA: hypothetical protein [Caudoviricetes sp.]